MKESLFQARLKEDLRALFPGCIILKNDPNCVQGFPDLTILYNNNWAVLECKKSLKEPFQPNQEYYLELCDGMSFGSMICPENKENVLYELQRAFQTRRPARLP